MKKIISLLMAGALTLSVAAQDNTNNSLFNANELGVSLSTVTDFDSDYRHNATLGVSYSITRNLGVEVSAPIYLEDGGNILDSASVGGSFRLPITRNLALSVRVLGNYNWESENWNGVVGPTVSFRLNPKWEVFASADYNFTKFNKEFNEGDWTYGLGLRLFL